MVLLDIKKSHEDSPDFREALANLEGMTSDLEKRLKKLCSLCQERQSAARREQELTQELVAQFEDLAGSSESSDTTTSSVDVITTALKQLVDNQERMFEQINIGIVQPLQHFLSHDIEHLQASRKSYRKARTEAVQAAERFGQCKKYEMNLMAELSTHLYDSRYELHKAACNYAMDLNLLQSKRLPDFLQRLVDFMTCQLSYFHLGHITVKDTEPHITSLYTTLEALRNEATSQDTRQRSLAQKLLEQVALKRASELLHLHTCDLHLPREQAMTSVRRLVSKVTSEPFSELTVKEEDKETLVKHGYLCYAEPKTFGTTWIRLYFSIQSGKLVCEESKVKVPISLSLSLCSVKLAEPVDTERNFCFKVISPSRTLLLQAEGSQAMRDWMEALTRGITAALDLHQLVPEAEPSHQLADGSPRPVKPPRPKKKVSVLKEIYSVSGNEECADCGVSSPKWASVNIGVVLCIECSGVHRSLGVYISQARSLTLDTLKPEWVDKLKQVGNTNANSVYEELLPVDFDRATVRKADKRRQFITDKYTNMCYTSEQNKQRITEERQAARAESLRKSQTLLKPSSDQDVDNDWVQVITPSGSHDNSPVSHDDPPRSHDPQEPANDTANEELHKQTGIVQHTTV